MFPGFSDAEKYCTTSRVAVSPSVKNTVARVVARCGGNRRSERSWYIKSFEYCQRCVTISIFMVLFYPALSASRDPIFS